MPAQSTHLRVLDPITGQVIRASKVITAARYERARPGELIHMDVKKLAVRRLLIGGLSERK